MIKSKLLELVSMFSEKVGVRGDYILHFSLCMLSTTIIGITSFIVVNILIGYYPALVASLFGAVFAAGLSIGKEAGDENNPASGWSWWDLVADGFGIVTGLLVLAILIVMLF